MQVCLMLRCFDSLGEIEDWEYFDDLLIAEGRTFTVLRAEDAGGPADKGC